MYSLTLNVFIDMFSSTLKINKEAIRSRIGVSAAQLYNYQDIPLYASDDKVYFPPATKICQEEMSSTAMQSFFFGSCVTDSISPHIFPLFPCCSAPRQLLSSPSLHLPLISSTPFTLTSFASNYFFCSNSDNKNYLGGVNLAVSHHRLRPTVVKTFLMLIELHVF